MKLTFDEAWRLIGGLSEPSKMPWWGYSIPAKACITGARLVKKPGSVCFKCYAMKGYYRFNNVKRSMAHRLKSLSDPRWADAMVVVLSSRYWRQRNKNVKEDRFRWHDSGDLQSVDHLRMINDVAERTPFLRHYLPTKEVGIVRAFKEEHDIARNLFIKLSHPMVGVDYNDQPLGMSYSTVNVEGPHLFQCPALRQGHKCLSCDMCWKPGNINYQLH